MGHATGCAKGRARVITAEVVICGAGITGIATAHAHLRQEHRVPVFPMPDDALYPKLVLRGPATNVRFCLRDTTTRLRRAAGKLGQYGAAVTTHSRYGRGLLRCTCSCMMRSSS